MEESAPLMGCSGPAKKLGGPDDKCCGHRRPTVEDLGKDLAETFHACIGAPPPLEQDTFKGPEDGKMTFRDLQKFVGVWQDYNFGPQPPHRMVLGAAEEVGELCHAQLKMEQAIRGTPEEHNAAAKDAVGDAIIYLANYCTVKGFNLQQIMEDTWREISKRDWKKFPKNGLSE